MSLVIDNTMIVAFDVDNTLVLWDSPNPNMEIDGVKLEVHTEHVEEIKRFKARGQYVIVWSAGGVRWAETVVRLLDLADHVDLIMTKPQWLFDDLPPSEWCRVFFRGHK